MLITNKFLLKGKIRLYLQNIFHGLIEVPNVYLQFGHLQYIPSSPIVFQHTIKPS
jgi:hypothetical protein